MHKLVNAKISISVLHILIAVGVLAAGVGFYNFVYRSDYVPSLDCMTIARGYLGYVQDHYGDRPDFDSTIWPRAVEVESHIHSVCVDSIDNNGLIDGKSIEQYLKTSKKNDR